MTPEGSQSLDELPNSEENNNHVSDASSSNGNGVIRVKNVSEINSNEAEAVSEATTSPTNKRKLPTWMSLSSSQSIESNKKRRMPTRKVQSASTSRVVDEPGNDSDPSSSNDCAVQNKTQNNEDNEVDGYNENLVPDRATNQADEANVNGSASPHNEAEAEVKPDVSEAPTTSHSSTSGQSHSTVAVKPEQNDDEDDSPTVGQITKTSPRGIKKAVKVEKEEATSTSTTRPTCRFGIRCYRMNPAHRQEEAHPGDKDYKRPNFPSPPDGTPACPYGDLCYRRNPVHFQQFSHPPSTDFEQNWKNYKMRLRQRKNKPAVDPNSSYSDLDDDYDLDDPFINDDSDDDFVPNDDDDEDDDDFL